MRLGIDIGTCFSKAAFIVENQTQHNREIALLRNPANQASLYPSSIYINQQGQLLTGQEAEEQRQLDPLHYRRNIKDFLWSKAEVFWEKTISYEEMMLALISRIVRDFERKYHQPVISVVATVPASYNEAQRNFVYRMYQRLGIYQIQLVTGPLAIIENYTIDHTLLENEAVLVYDLGGNFDAAILQRRGSHYLCRSLGVPKNCGGGRSFDKEIYNNLRVYLRGVQSAWDQLLDTANSAQEAAQVRVAARRACLDVKHQLSTKEQATVSIDPGIAGLSPVSYALSRAQFEEMIAPYVQQSIQHCRALLQQYNVSWDGLSQVVLAGGSASIPFIASSLEKHFSRPVSKCADTTAEAQGAAVYGDRLAAHPWQQVVASLSDIFAAIEDALTYEREAILPFMTYKEAIGYFVTDKPADPRVQKGAMIQQPDPQRQGIIFTQVFLDESNHPVVRFDGVPYGRKLLVRQLDQELRDAFGSKQVVFVE